MDIATIDAFGKSSGIYAFMNTAWAWPFVEALHYTGLALLLGTVGLFDLRVLGVARGVSMAALHKFVPIGVGAYLISVTTGAMFFYAAWDQYLYNPAFQLKMLCMAIAGLNMVMFYATTARAVKSLSPYGQASIAAKCFAAVSLLSWTSVIVFGRIITMFRPPYHSCPWC